MHPTKTVIFVLLTTSLMAHAELKKKADFMTTLKQARTEFSLQSVSNAAKADKLNEIKKNLETAMDDYEKANPEEGDENEHGVADVYNTFDPVFDFLSTKMKPKDCETTKHDLIFSDTIGKSANDALSEETQEALAWLELFCANK